MPSSKRGAQRRRTARLRKAEKSRERKMAQAAARLLKADLEPQLCQRWWYYNPTPETASSDQIIITTA